MKVYNQNKNQLTPQLINLLNSFRKKRNFNVNEYIKAKCLVINEYFSLYNIQTAVVGLSGGIDSAVVLSLLHEAAKLNNSPIKNIIPVLLPLTKSQGATNQSEATKRGQELCRSLQLQDYVIDLSSVEDSLRGQVEPVVKIQGKPWAVGQLVSYLRTPSLYYVTSLFSQEGSRAVVCGTTNQDEGAYLGYFGKASDGLVDIQIVSDLHKSEVFKVGEKLKVPSSILNVAPSGDMYDGRVDEEVFGASYNFVEIYMNFLRMNQNLQQKILNSLDSESLQQFKQGQINLENMHKYNGHKYIGSSPAVHLDVLVGNVPSGWKNNKTIAPSLMYTSKFVNPIEFPPEIINQISLDSPVNYSTNKLIIELGEVFKPNETSLILNFLNTQNWVPTGKDGYTKTFNPLANPGSYRVSSYSQELADLLWYKIKEFIPALRICDEKEKTDSHPYQVWTAIGINPLMRFIQYKDQGELIPHYDAPFVYHDKKRTLKTLVIYLTTNKGGDTRFIIDIQDKIDFNQRNFNDWIESPSEDLIDFSFSPKSGNAILFDHRFLHDSKKINNEIKIILRTDIIYEKGGL